MFLFQRDAMSLFAPSGTRLNPEALGTYKFVYIRLASDSWTSCSPKGCRFESDLRSQPHGGWNSPTWRLFAGRNRTSAAVLDEL
jgi:hypothetical protein